MCMQVNPNSGIANDFHLRYFHMCGRVLGKALMDGQITPVHLVQPMYKHLMGWPVTLRDLEHIDDQVYRNLLELLDFDDIGRSQCILYILYVMNIYSMAMCYASYPSNLLELLDFDDIGRYAISAIYTIYLLYILCILSYDYVLYILS